MQIRVEKTYEKRSRSVML